MSKEHPKVDVLVSPEVKVVRSDVMQKDYPIETATKAYSEFMLGNKTPAQIAEKLGIPTIVVEEWSRKNKWSLRQAEYALESIRALNTEVGKKQAEARLATVTSHIEKARAVVQKAHDEALIAATPNALKSATEAMAAAATMEARAVGLAEKTIQRDVDAEDHGKTAPTPYVFIGLHAMAPVVKAPEASTIDVVSQEVK